MTNRFHHFRQALGMALVWAAAWFAAGVVVARVPGFDADLPFAVQFAPFGFVTGLAFFGILAATGGGQGNDGASRLRLSLWGALGGLPSAFVIATLRSGAVSRELVVFGPLLALAGALSAVTRTDRTRGPLRPDAGATSTDARR